MSQLTPIRVSANGRYFETTDSRPFLFIGANDAITWPGLAGLYRRRDLPAVEAYLEQMASSGVTVLRLMLEYAQQNGRYFERPARRFNPPMVQLWDDLFALCAQVGLRVLLTPWDNFWMSRRWHHHPYNQANGGPAHAPESFFTDEDTIAATIRRFQFVVERWGDSGVIAAWDLFNEVHPYWGGSPSQQAAVITRLSDAVREIEERLWGFTRPQTVSIFGPAPEPDYEHLIFRHPSLDFATTHVYSAGAIDYPEDTVSPAQTMARWVRHALARVPLGRPYMDTEHGPIHLFNDHKRMLDEDFDDEYERHLMWAHLATGGAGSGMRWPARHPHVLTPGMQGALASLAGFTALLDWQRFNTFEASEDVRVAARGIIPFACRSGDQAIVWLLREKPSVDHRGPLPAREPLRDVPLVLSGIEPGLYCVHRWNTREGRLLDSNLLRAQEDGLRITLSEVDNDLALAVVRATE